MSRLVQLGPGEEADALEFCARYPERTIAISGWLQDGGLQRHEQATKAWLFADAEDRRVEGLVYVSDNGIVIPVLSSPDGLDALVALGSRNPHAVRVVVGERWLVNDLVNAWAPLGFRPRLSREQIAYTVDQDTFVEARPPLELRPAELSDLEQVVSASAEMAREEAGDDPQARNPKLFRQRIKERLGRGRDFICTRDEALVFKSNVAALSAFGGQIEGIFVPRNHRGRSLGLSGTQWVTRWILDRSHRATLLVNDDNSSARSIYERLGYTPTHESRTIFFS